jgi:hypothetical protein
VGPWRYRFAEDRVRDEQPSPDEVAALRDAVLAWHEELAGPALEAAESRVRRWLALPRMLAGLVRMLTLGRPPAFLVADQEAARLYQRLRGIDPKLARAEVWRMSEQLGSLDQRLLALEADRPGRPPGADRAELEAAAGALAEWYLRGRRRDDELLGEVEAAWAAVEEAQAQQEGVPAGLRGRGLQAWLERTDEQDEREEAAIDRYVAAWRRWLDRHAQRPAPAGAGSRLVAVPRDAPQQPRQPVSAEELPALREAVLAWQEGLHDPVAASRSMRLVGWLSARHLGWLALPWQLLLVVRIFRLPRRPEVTASHDRAVALYRRRSFRDPEVARAEVDRLGVQLHGLSSAGYGGRCGVACQPGRAGGRHRGVAGLVSGRPAQRRRAAWRGRSGVGGVGGAGPAGARGVPGARAAWGRPRRAPAQGPEGCAAPAVCAGVAALAGTAAAAGQHRRPAPRVMAHGAGCRTTDSQAVDVYK